MDRNITIHPSALISEQFSVGGGTSVWQNCIIMDGAVIGENCSLGANVFVESGAVIGNRVKIKNNIAIYSGVVCEDDVFLGPNCVFTNVINPRSFISRKSEFQPTVVKKGASIGANATIICGTTIGSYALVGAGAVVTKDVSPYTIVTGNPARFQGYVCKCGVTLQKENNVSKESGDFCDKRTVLSDGTEFSDEILICPDCGNEYRLEQGEIAAVREE